MTYSAPDGIRVGHIHLKVSDLERAIAFYAGVLGFELQQRYGDRAAFLSAGGYHRIAHDGTGNRVRYRRRISGTAIGD